VSTLAEIEAEIAKLTEEDLSKLLRWMEELDSVRRKETQDAASEALAEKGGLDAGWQNALKQIEAGATTPLEVAVSYYAQGFVSMGKATELSRLSRWAFEAALADRKIERNYSKEDLEADLARARRTST
jgi:predicted HTH domain antitoxin